MNKPVEQIVNDSVVNIVDDLRLPLERAYPWDYVEDEGECTRFEWKLGMCYFRIYKNGDVEGDVPNNEKVREILNHRFENKT